MAFRTCLLGYVVDVDGPGFDPVAVRAMDGAVAARGCAREQVLVEASADEVASLDALGSA